MTATELARLIDWCEDYWPGTRNYRSVSSAAADFAPLSYDDCKAAVNEHMTEKPGRAPYISEILVRARTIAQTRRHLDPETTGCDLTGGRHGVLAIFEDLYLDLYRAAGKNIPEGHRLAQCLDCGAEVIRRADLLETVGERDQRMRRGEAPRHATAGTGDRSDRIAP